jgi:hypothetical protein
MKKKVLAIVLTVVLLTALALPFSAIAAYIPPPELTAEYTDAGTWPLPAGTYYPELDNQKIPNGAHVISAYTMDANYVATPLPVPASLTGYEKVTGVANLGEGKWTLIDVLGYPYILLLEVGAGANNPPAAPADYTFTLSELPDVSITITNANPMYAYAPFFMNPAQNSYTFFVNDGGTVTFSTDVNLTFVDATTYATTEKTITAGTAVSATEISGGSLYFTDTNGNFATFALTSDPMYAQGLSAATFKLSDLASGVSPTIPSVPIAPAPPVAPAAPSVKYIDSIMIRLKELPSLNITITNAYPRYAYGPFVFNAAQNAYTIYLASTGTVTFSKDTTLSFVNAMTYVSTEKTFTAGTPVPAAQVSGGAMYFDGNQGDFATFAVDTDPTYSGGIFSATLDLTALETDGSTPAISFSPTTIRVLTIVVIFLIPIIAAIIISSVVRKKLKASLQA